MSVYQTDNDESSDESTVHQRRTQKKTQNKQNKYMVEIPKEFCVGINVYNNTSRKI